MAKIEKREKVKKEFRRTKEEGGEEGGTRDATTYMCPRS
jgi:hypothetical protein